jgi:RimJ/RimL family protein N-acetyltransferase
MALDAGVCVLRRFRADDREALVRLANDRRVWRNLTDQFPHPFSEQDADNWLLRCAEEGRPTRNFAIEVDGELVGAIGLDLLEGEKAGVGNVGYWIAPAFWNQGIATDALRTMTRYAFSSFSLRRLQASVFGWNSASRRVLEKCGYELEGRLRGAISKEGDVTDELWYGMLNPEIHRRP